MSCQRRLEKGFKIVLVGVLSTTLLLFQANVSAVETVNIPKVIPFDEGSSVPNADKCQLGKKLSYYLASYSSSIQISDTHIGTRYIDMKITEVHAPRGAYSGSKWMAVTGTLMDNGTSVASFRTKRITDGGVFGVFKVTCSIIRYAAKAVARDISDWLDNPVDGALLGQFGKSYTFVPADILYSPRRLSSRIKYPRHKLHRDVFVRCETFIDTLGKYKANNCYNDGPEAHQYRQSILKVTVKARAIPATANGVKIGVWMQYAVLFGSDGKEISVVPNHNPDVISYGVNYQAPQRYHKTYCGPVGKYIFNLDYTVSGSGDVERVSVSSKNKNAKRIERIRGCWMRSKYIPATLNKETVRADIQEPYF